jgi:hypothetical protein
MKADYEDRAQMSTDFSDHLRELEELSALLEQQSSDSASPEGGDGSDSLDSMIQHSSSTTELDDQVLYARAMKGRSQHNASFESLHAELKASLQRARTNLATYEQHLQKRDLAQAELDKLYKRNLFLGFLATVADKQFKLPYSEIDYNYFSSQMGLSPLDKEYYSLICQKTNISDFALRKEQKERLVKLIDLVKVRVETRAFSNKSIDGLTAYIDSCDRDILSLSGSKAEVAMLMKTLSLALLSLLTEHQYKIKSLLANYEQLNIKVILEKFAVALDNDRHTMREWPPNKEKLAAMMQKLEYNQHLLSEASENIALAKSILNEIQSTLVMLNSIEKEYSDCELEAIPVLEYQALYAQWHDAKDMPGQCSQVIGAFEANTLPQLEEVVACDEQVLAEYQRRVSLLANFEQRLQEYIDGKKLRKMPAAITGIFHNDTSERIPYMTNLLAMLKEFSQGKRFSIAEIKSKIHDVLDNPNKFLTKEVGDAKKKTLRGILEDLITDIRVLYPESLTVDSFELIDITPETLDETDCLGKGFNY